MSTTPASWRLAARLGRRELRGGLRGFRVFLACLALGVAAIAAIGSLSTAIQEGLRQDARAILGGDFEIRTVHQPASEAQQSWLDEHATIARTAVLRAMARPAAAENGAAGRMLVEVKAVDGAYPLYGAVRLADGGGLDGALERRDGRWGAVVERGVLHRLGLRVGDVLRVGEAELAIRGVIEREPDRGTGIAIWGPRLMMARGALDTTGLIQPGSLIHYHYLVKLPPGADPAAWQAELDAALPEAAWRVRDLSDAGEGLREMIDRMTLYLTLVGLTALLVGGVGVANAVKSYLDGRAPTIATLKTLGAPAALVFRIYMVQIGVLAALGTAIGLAVGAAAPWALGGLLGELLPVSLRIGVYAGPLALAAAFGLLTALVFSLWPLAGAREVPAARLFRELVAPARHVGRRDLALIGAAAAALAALAVVTAADRVLALWFVAGAVGTLAALRVAAAGIMRLAAHASGPRRGGAAWRLALANLHRPGAPTPSVVLSLGVGLTVLVTVALIQANLDRQVRERLPEAAPDYFFIDIQPDQVEPFETLLAGIDGVQAVERMPMLRARIVAVDGMPADQVETEQDWALESERGLTYSAEPPANAEVVAGEWWPADYDGPPLISFTADLARGMGLEIGDTLTFDVLGRRIEGRIANLRQVDWSDLSMNFTVIFAPGTLETAPHTHIATVRTSDSAEQAVLDAVAARFDNVSAVRVKEVLETVSDLFNRISMAVRGTAAVTLLAGTLVLASALASEHRRRIYDAVVLKVLGATRGRVLQVFAIEFGLLGLAAAAVAAVLGTVAAYFVVTAVMKANWVFVPSVVATTVAACTAATVLLGLAGTWRALSHKAAPLLRND